VLHIHFGVCPSHSYTCLVGASSKQTLRLGQTLFFSTQAGIESFRPEVKDPIAAEARVMLRADEGFVPQGGCRHAEIPGKLRVGGVDYGYSCVKLAVIAIRQGRGTGRSDSRPCLMRASSLRQTIAV
jgi:hypothetical protein